MSDRAHFTPPGRGDDRFVGAQRVRIRGTYEFEVYVMPPGVDDAFTGGYNHGTLVRQVESDVREALAYYLGYAAEAEEGDGIITPCDPQAVAAGRHGAHVHLSYLDFENLAPVDPAEVLAVAQAVLSERLTSG